MDGGQLHLFPELDGMGDGRELRDVEYLHMRAKRITNRVPEASRMPFKYTINAYRGCAHACTYCFARPTHVYLGMDAGADFERRIVVKVNAVERLRAELRDPRWGGEHIAMGTNTDPYQPAEGRYRLTRGLIAELTAARNPFSILTKSPMILREICWRPLPRPGSCAATSRSGRWTRRSGARASRARRRRGGGSRRSRA